MQNDQKLKSLLTQVKKMRQLQKAFFKTSYKTTNRTEVLEASKKQEALVDALIGTMEIEMSGQQTDLGFNNTRSNLETTHY
jgi:phosphoenolpyruvate carboxylase